MKQMSLCTACELGLIQEANRQFFHPIGLVLTIDLRTWNLQIIDHTEDEPTGLVYPEKSLDPVKYRNFACFRAIRERVRVVERGFIQQPIPGMGAESV